MNIGLVAKLMQKREAILKLNPDSPEALDRNLDALDANLRRITAALDAYEIDLASDDDVTGYLGLSHLAGATSGHLLTANGDSSAPSWQAPATPTGFIPVVGGTVSTAGKRVAWHQKADGLASSAMASVGQAAPTITGGTGSRDADGAWATPQSAVGGLARFSTTVFAWLEHLPTLRVRMRTNSTLANVRLMVSLNENVAGVNTDTPSTATQRGIYVRYSTAIPDGGWVVQTVDGAGRTTSSTVLAIATSTIYLIQIVVDSVSSVRVIINGTTHTATANLIAGITLGAEIMIADLSAAASVQCDIESVYWECR